MTALRSFVRPTAVVAGLSLLAACATAPIAPVEDGAFEADRDAILAMAGEYKVTFDFTETVPLQAGYELKEPKLSGGYEVVRVVKDEGDFISLQHTLVVGPEGGEIPIKHWRQDWTYEPEDVLVFIGGNAWETRDVAPSVRAGAWSQEVYQVDDSPRYGAVARWSHDNGVSAWTPPAEMRPLPRRDMTTRDDYDAVLAVNRHAITPFGWVHEQDNTKLILAGGQQALVREVGVNTYRRSDEFPEEVADQYWAQTEEYWTGVVAEWARLEASEPRFGLTIQGEPEALYMPLLGLATQVADGEIEPAAAVEEAREVIADYTTADIGTLQSRVSQRVAKADEDY